MRDILFTGGLFIGFVLLKLFADMCEKQIENRKD